MTTGSVLCGENWFNDYHWERVEARRLGPEQVQLCVCKSVALVDCDGRLGGAGLNVGFSNEPGDVLCVENIFTTIGFPIFALKLQLTFTRSCGHCSVRDDQSGHSLHPSHSLEWHRSVSSCDLSNIKIGGMQDTQHAELINDYKITKY